MPSQPIIERATQHRIASELGQLQRLRTRQGLSRSTASTRDLNGVLARRLGLSGAPGSQGHVTVRTEELVQALFRWTRELEPGPERWYIAAVTWNVQLIPGDHDLRELDIVGPNLDWGVRVRRLEAQCKKDSTLLPQAWSNERAIREQSDLMLFDLLRLLYPDGPDAVEPAKDSHERPAPRVRIDTAHQPVPKTDPATAEALDASLRVTEDFLEFAEPSSDHVERLADLTQTLSQAYGFARPAQVLEQASELNKRVLATIQSTQSPSVRAELYVVAGKLFGLLSYSTLDLGDADSAHRHVKAQMKTARLAGHDELLAWSLGTEAMIRRFERDFRRSLQPVEQGLELKVSPMARARLLGQYMLGCSEIRDSEGVENAIAEASECLQSGTPPSPELSDGIYLFPLSKYHYYAGSGLLGLGPDYSSRAGEHSRQAIELFQFGSPDEQSYSDELLARVHQATAELRLDSLDAVPEVLDRLFDADPESRTSWHLQWLMRLTEFLERNPRYKGSQVSASISERTKDFRNGLAAAGSS